MKKPIAIIAEDVAREDYYPFSGLEETVEVFDRLEPDKLSLLGSFDLVILDCGENPESGIRSVQEIKKQHTEVPIIFITAASSEEIMLKAFTTGAREYIIKPVNSNLLQMMITKILGFKRLPREKRIPATGNYAAGAVRSVTLDLPDRIKRVLEHIEVNYSRDLKLDNLAGIACLSKYHFSRTFKLYVGMNPMEFVTYVRVEKAKLFLSKADINVTAATYKAGFKDISNFIKNFKQLTSLTPHKYKSLQTKLCNNQPKQQK